MDTRKKTVVTLDPSDWFELHFHDLTVEVKPDPGALDACPQMIVTRPTTDLRAIAVQTEVFEDGNPVQYDALAHRQVIITAGIF